jgi:hypothetical protein
LLVCFKTLIYFGQLCNNALNYPNTPLTRPLVYSILHNGLKTSSHDSILARIRFRKSDGDSLPI